MYDFTQLVKMGWDDYARTTRAERNISSEYPILKIFSGLLPKNSNVLDVGCGSGKPITKYFLDEGFSMQGLDISPLQVEKARSNLGYAKVLVADIKSHEFESNAYDGMVCLHSIEHVERIWHGKIFKKMYTALKPGGLLLISVQKESYESVKYLNPYIQMYYSHFDQFETIKLLNAAQFSIIYKKPVNIFENESIYLIAKKEGTLRQRKMVHHTVYISSRHVLG